MRPHRILSAFIPALAAAAFCAQAAVVVTFVQPERFTDAGDRSWDREENIKRLDQYLHELGSKYLAPDQTLRIDVLDVDLAGWAQFGGRGAHKFRTVTGRSDFPQMRVRYTLESPRGRAETREETVDDTSYLTRNLTRRSAYSEPLYYEKRMLDDWFRARFADGVRR